MPVAYVLLATLLYCMLDMSDLIPCILIAAIVALILI